MSEIKKRLTNLSCACCNRLATVRIKGDGRDWFVCDEHAEEIKNATLDMLMAELGLKKGGS